MTLDINNNPPPVDVIPVPPPKAVQLIVTTTEEGLQQACKYANIQYVGPMTNLGMVNGGVADNGDYIDVVYLKRDHLMNDPMDDVFDTIAHEAVHVAQSLFSRMGENNPSSEFMAYTIAGISASIFRHLQKDNDLAWDRRPIPQE